MITIYDANMRAVARSRNLRGILTYSRKCTVQRVDIWPAKNGAAQCGIEWVDGATTITDFASFDVCQQWFMSRPKFSWAVRIHDGGAQ